MKTKGILEKANENQLRIRLRIDNLRAQGL